MPDSLSIENDFLSKLTDIIEDNISNDQFGVSELAREAGMSRSNLLRKVKKLTKSQPVYQAGTLKTCNRDVEADFPYCFRSIV